MNKSRVIVACSILIVILGGFAYAYFNKVNAFNQTKSDLESLGYEISNNVSGMAISTFIKSASVVPMVDFASFVSIARQYNSTTIYEEGFSFYVVTVLIIVITAYEYTPNHSIWWFWG
jgi:magnesium-transporting ATPase (P-type)